MEYHHIMNRATESALHADTIMNRNLTRLNQELSPFQGLLRDRLYGSIDSASSEGERWVRVPRQLILRNATMRTSWFTRSLTEMVISILGIGYLTSLITMILTLFLSSLKKIPKEFELDILISLIILLNMIINIPMLIRWINWSGLCSRSDRQVEEILKWELEVIDDLRSEGYSIELLSDEYQVRW